MILHVVSKYTIVPVYAKDGFGWISRIVYTVGYKQYHKLVKFVRLNQYRIP